MVRWTAVCFLAFTWLPVPLYLLHFWRLCSWTFDILFSFRVLKLNYPQRVEFQKGTYLTSNFCRSGQYIFQSMTAIKTCLFSSRVSSSSRRLPRGDKSILYTPSPFFSKYSQIFLQLNTSSPPSALSLHHFHCPFPRHDGSGGENHE